MQFYHTFLLLKKTSVFLYFEFSHLVQEMFSTKKRGRVYLQIVANGSSKMTDSCCFSSKKEIPVVTKERVNSIKTDIHINFFFITVNPPFEYIMVLLAY